MYLIQYGNDESAVYRRLISIISSVPMNTLYNPQTDYQKEVIKILKIYQKEN